MWWCYIYALLLQSCGCSCGRAVLVWSSPSVQQHYPCYWACSSRVLVWLNPSGGVGTVWVWYGTWYGTWYGIMWGTVCDVVCWYCMMVDILNGKITVCGMVCGMAKYCLVVWYVSVYKVRKSRIRRTNIICNGLIYRSLKRVRKHKACGQTDRQTDTFAVTETDTQFYKVRIPISHKNTPYQFNEFVVSIPSMNILDRYPVYVLRKPWPSDIPVSPALWYIYLQCQRTSTD